MREPTRIIILGASGNAGGCLVLAALGFGHDVTVFVRDARRLASRFGGRVPAGVRVVEGDALDPGAVGRAMEGREAAIGAVGHNRDSRVFEALCRNIVAQASARLKGGRRLWFFGGLPALDVPFTRIMGTDLPGMPPLFRSHKTNFETLRESDLDWSFICPGPMYFTGAPGEVNDLKITTGTMPYEIGAWTRFLPKIAHPFIIRSRLGTMTVPYEDVARLIMANLGPGGPYSWKRVGTARPGIAGQFNQIGI